MKALILLAFVIVALAYTPTPEQLDKIRMMEVERLNSQPGMTWKAGISKRFQGQPLAASKSILGLKGGKARNRQVLETAIRNGQVIRMPPLSAEERAAIPASFDSATNWPQCASILNNIRDQSNCGCCWAFGATEAASGRMCISTNGALQFPLSVQEMCFCASFDGCGGGDTTTPWLYIQYNGLSTGADQGNGTFDKGGYCSAFSLPHCHHHGPQRNDPYPDEGAPGCPSQNSPACPAACDSTARAPHNNFKTDRYTFNGTVAAYSDVASIQQAIMLGGPVEAAFTVYSDFENYVSGIYQYTSGDELGGHAIEIVGWGTENGVDYWKIKNSWNPYWGENGYFRMIRGVDNCGIEDDITASSTGAVYHKLGSFDE